VLGDLQQPKNLWLQSLKSKGKIGRVRVQTTILRGKGEDIRGVAGAGGLGGIGARADTKQQVRRRRRGTFWGRSRGPSKKDLEKVQTRLVRLRRKERNVSQEMHGRGVRGEAGHQSRVKRRSEVLCAPQTLEESACKKKQTANFSAKRQSFKGVTNAHQSHGWGGSVGRDRGKRHVQLGGGVACVTREKKNCEQGKNTKVDGEQKKR
jgi:hypothetical protein